MRGSALLLSMALMGALALSSSRAMGTAPARSRAAVREQNAQPAPALIPTLDYAAYLRTANAVGIALDGAGDQYIVGAEPASGASGGASIVLKLSAAHHVLYRVHIPGVASAVAVDPRGDAYVVGYCTSRLFPVVHAMQSHSGGARDGFLVALNPQGGIRYSTYLGGSGDDEASAVALDDRGGVYVTGYSFSPPG